MTTNDIDTPPQTPTPKMTTGGERRGEE